MSKSRGRSRARLSTSVGGVSSRARARDRQGDALPLERRDRSGSPGAAGRPPLVLRTRTYVRRDASGLVRPFVVWRIVVRRGCETARTVAQREQHAVLIDPAVDPRVTDAGRVPTLRGSGRPDPARRYALLRS